MNHHNKTKQSLLQIPMQELNGDSLREQNGIINQASGLDDYFQKIDDSSSFFSNDALERKAKEAIIEITRNACEEQLK